MDSFKRNQLTWLENRMPRKYVVAHTLYAGLILLNIFSLYISFMYLHLHLFLSFVCLIMHTHYFKEGKLNILKEIKEIRGKGNGILISSPLSS